MKKIFTFVLIFALLMSSFCTYGFASDYQGHWAEDVINKFVEDKIISGNESGNINPDVNIKRSEFVKIINRYFKYTEKAESNFNDITSDKWYADEFLIAKKAGFITGDQNGNANPESPVTRAEVCVILSRLLNLPIEENVLPQGEEIPDWAKNAVNSVFKAGYIKGYEDGSLRVYSNITRAEAVSVISRCETGKAPAVQESVPVNNNGNITGMGSSAGGSFGGGGGGGGSSAPVGVTPARIDVRNFDKDTFELDLTANFIDEFVFTLEVGGDTYTYDKNSILPNKVSSGYTFNTYDIVLKTVKERQLNNELYKIYVKGIASGNRPDTANIKVYEGNVVIDLPAPSGLTASYNTDGTVYNKDEYKLSWNVVDNVKEYQWSLYNSSEENATPVTGGVITSQSLEAGATVASTVVAINSEWGDRENLYFTVSAKDKQTDILSMPTEPKYLLLDAPKVTGVTYEGNDVYKIAYEKDSEATYEVKIGDTLLSDGVTYKPADSDKVMAVKVKGFYEDNETKPSSYEYDFTYGGGDGENAPYVITSPRQFKNIADNPDKNFVLGCDIAFEGTYNGVSTFSGTLDGACYTVDLGDNATQGLFAQVRGAEIKNLTVKGTVNATLGAGAGAFAGAAKESATFINCINYADVISKSGSQYVGGILGNGYDGCSSTTFENCVNFGKVDVNGNTNNSSNGGITGVGKDTKIDTCVNYGRIDGQSRAGGLIGWSTNNLEISNCANFGRISSKVNGSYVGGAAGYLGSASTGSVKNFVNAGQANFGVVGVYAGSPSISNCINVGTTTNAMVGSGTVTTVNCYYLKDKGSDSTGAISKTSDELKALTLDGFAIQEGFDYPLPTGIVYVEVEDSSIIKISSAEDFMKIKDDLSGSYKLTADITLTQGLTETFSGTFDGNGHTITIGSEESPATQGVFASAKDFTIKNLTVKGTINTNTNAGAFVGAAPGNANFINCKNYANITINKVVNYVGGILGNGYDGSNGATATFTDCVNYGKIDATGYTTSSIGGIAGVGRNVIIKTCVNYGVMAGKNRAGGLVGWNTTTLNVSNSANFGKVSSLSYGSQVGGAIGYLQGSATVSNFINAGQVNQGIVGYRSDGTNGTPSISNCINAGTTNNAITNLPSVTTTNCYFLEDKGNDSTGATKKTSDELKALTLDGFAKQEGFDYPLPTGITYSPIVTE